MNTRKQRAEVRAECERVGARAALLSDSSEELIQTYIADAVRLPPAKRNALQRLLVRVSHMAVHMAEVPGVLVPCGNDAGGAFLVDQTNTAYFFHVNNELVACTYKGALTDWGDFYDACDTLTRGEREYIEERLNNG